MAQDRHQTRCTASGTYGSEVAHAILVPHLRHSPHSVRLENRVIFALRAKPENRVWPLYDEFFLFGTFALAVCRFSVAEKRRSNWGFFLFFGKKSKFVIQLAKQFFEIAMCSSFFKGMPLLHWEGVDPPPRPSPLEKAVTPSRRRLSFWNTPKTGPSPRRGNAFSRSSRRRRVLAFGHGAEVLPPAPKTEGLGERRAPRGPAAPLHPPRGRSLSLAPIAPPQLIKWGGTSPPKPRPRKALRASRSLATLGASLLCYSLERKSFAFTREAYSSGGKGT